MMNSLSTRVVHDLINDIDTIAHLIEIGKHDMHLQKEHTRLDDAKVKLRELSAKLKSFVEMTNK